MSTARDWIVAARPLAQANLAAPLLFGQALAFALTGCFEVSALVAVMVFSVLDHLVIVFGNDYADRETDVGGESRTPFSGGSGVLPDARITPRALARAAMAAAALLLAHSIFLSVRFFAPAVLLGVAALALLHAYSFSPLRLSYRGHGEWLQGLGVGAVLPLLGFGVQAGSLDSFPWPVLLGTVLLGVAGNISTALPDLADDRRAKKTTWPVRRGLTRSAWDCVGITLLALAVLFLTLPGKAAAVAAISAAPLLVVAWLAPRTRSQTVRFIMIHGLSAQGALLGTACAMALGL